MNEATTTLDVRTIPPRERHPLIFTRLDALAPGAALVLVNDHDPKPLRYQLMAERPEQFAWEPQKEGPEEWKILISRVAGKANEVSEQQSEPPVAQLINLREQLSFNDQHPQARLLFESQEVRLVGFALRAGQEIREHRSPSRLLAQVIEGDLTFTVAEQPFTLHTGLVLEVDAGTPHSLRAIADTLLLLVMAPDPAQIHAENQARH